MSTFSHLQTMSMVELYRGYELLCYGSEREEEIRRAILLELDRRGL